MKTETVYAKLKTEIIPIPEDDFIRAIADIKHYQADEDTVISLLESAFKDEDESIKSLIDQEFIPNWGETASATYKSLIGKLQAGFSTRIEKKFAPKSLDFVGKNEPMETESLEGSLIRLADIKIKDEYKENLPNGYKIGKTFDFYNRTGEFPKAIVLDESGYLVSGYTNYLIAKMLDIKELLCYNLQETTVEAVAK